MNALEDKPEFYFKDSMAYTEDGILIYNVLVYNVPSVITKDELNVYFEQFGEVKQLNFYGDKRQKQSIKTMAFVHFVDPCSAANVLIYSQHSIKNYKVFVRPCYGWTQPQTEDTILTIESKILEPSYIFNLDDDCLLHIINMLEFRERLSFARTCERFKAIYLEYSNVKDFDLCILNNITIFEAHELFKLAGQYIKNISGIIPTNGIDRYLAMILMFCNNAETIAFYDSRINTAIFRKWAPKCTKLTKLQLLSCTINDNCIEAIKRIPNLTSLTVTDCPRITGRYVDGIAKLTELCLPGCINISFPKLSCILSKLTELTKLDIRHCEHMLHPDLDYIISKYGTKLSEVKLSAIDLSYILETPQLKRLYIENHRPYMRMPSKLFQEMSTRTNLMLEHLSINITDSVNLERTKAIANLKNLKYLRIYSSSQLNDDCLRLLAKNLQQLEVIDLEKCRSITERGLMELVQKCENLKTLGIKRLKINNEKFILKVIEVLESRPTKKPAPLEIEILYKFYFDYDKLQENECINSTSLLSIKPIFKLWNFDSYSDSDDD